MKGKLQILIILFVASVALSSCSMIDELDCKVGYIYYRYQNNLGQDATDQIYKMTDFVFSKSDSVLRFVENNIMNGKMRKRPITLPDGEWVVVTYGNLNGSSKVDYTIGTTTFSQMSVRVVSTPTYTGTYAAGDETPSLRVGDSDKLYFGKLDFAVRGGYTDRIHTVEMSNVHIWLSAVVKWKDTSKAPTKAGSNLHVKLEYVPVEHSFVHDDKYDVTYKIPYRTPRITNERASHVARLQSSLNTAEGEFYFNTYGLRWESGGAPILRFYDGETLLLNKDLDLNRYFSDQGIDLTNTRVQFYKLEILIDGDNVVITTIGFADWDDGGQIW